MSTLGSLSAMTWLFACGACLSVGFAGGFLVGCYATSSLADSLERAERSRRDEF
jgi:hypothetical protein